MAAQKKLDPATEAMLKSQKAGPSPDHIRWVFEQYGARMSAGDTDGIVALFAEDAYIEDPVGSGKQLGHAALRKFYQGGFDAMGGPLEMKLEGAVRVSGSYGAAAYIVKTLNHTEPFRVETLDVMTFNDDGKITSMLAYWGPSNITPLKK
jgi:steroid delta-isomerase